MKLLLREICKSLLAPSNRNCVDAQNSASLATGNKLTANEASCLMVSRSAHSHTAQSYELKAVSSRHTNVARVKSCKTSDMHMHYVPTVGGVAQWLAAFVA